MRLFLFKFMEKRLENYIESLSKMINIPTVSEKGSFNKPVFDEFHNLLKKLFPNVFKNFKYEEFDGSFLLSYLVKNDLEPILLMSHHDVVSPNREWEHEPFNATIDNEKLYGRGTLDTKGNLWAILTSIEELLKENHKFNRSIYIESSCNEETTSTGAYNISRILKERGVHFHFTLDEGGMIVYDPIGGADGTFAMIALGEKDYCDLKFIAKSNGGHSSTPNNDNPLVRLSKFIVYVENHKLFKPHLDDLTIETFRKLSLKTKGTLGFAFKHAKGFRHLLARVMTKISPTASSMVKSTICFTKAKGSDEYNVVPDEAYVTGNIRISHHDTKDSIKTKLNKIASKFDIEIEEIDPGYRSENCNFNNEQFKFLCNVIESNFKDVIAAPYLSTGASDSRFFADLSENNFRFAPFICTNEQLDTIHAKDENVNISSLIPAVDFYKDLIKKA